MLMASLIRLGDDVFEWVSAAEGHCDGFNAPLIAC